MPTLSIDLPAPQEKLRNLAKVTADISKISDKRNELDADQPNVTAANNEEIRPDPNGERAGEIDEKKQRNEHANVKQLISFGPRVKRAIGIVTGFRDAGMNQSHIIDEKQPHSGRISGA